MKRIRNIGILTLLVVTLVIFSQCKGKEHPTIPNVAVNLSLDLSSATYNDLNTVGGYVYIAGGYRGILVYNVSGEEFMAYERTCPYDPHKSCAQIEVMADRIHVVDSCCTSEFLILDGSVLEGPSTLPLKRYRTSYDGRFLRIYN